MEEYFSQIPITNSKNLCVGPITKAEAAANDAGGDGLGYYIYVADTQNPNVGVDILAKLASPEAAGKLMNLLVGRFMIAAAS